MSASTSICLCTYNGAEYLSEQLASISAQTRPPDEVIIGDDGSKDGTVEVVERWASSVSVAVSIETRAVPLGRVANLESVLRRARSDIVFICDQDDRWRPEKMEQMTRVLESAPASAGAFCDSALIDEAGNPLAGSLWRTLRFGVAEQASVATGAGFEVLLRRNVVAGHALGFRRDKLDLLLPIPEIAHADWWLALGLLIDGGLVPLSDELVEYRLHGANSVGLRSRTSLARRITATNPRARSITDVALLEEFRLRLERARPGSLNDRDCDALQAKIAHSLFRASLSSSRLGRIVPALRALASGDYRHWSNGWQSAFVDVLGPAR